MAFTDALSRRPCWGDTCKHCERLDSQEDLKMSTEPGATQTRYTTTQVLSDHCDKAKSQEEPQAPAKSRDTCAGSQIFYVAALNLLTGAAGNRSPVVSPLGDSLWGCHCQAADTSQITKV